MIWALLNIIHQELFNGITTLVQLKYDMGSGIGVDSSDNIYNWLSYSGGDMIVTKYNSSGTIQWQRTLGDPTVYEDTATSSNSISIDSSDNIYIAFGTTDSQGPRATKTVCLLNIILLELFSGNDFLVDLITMKVLEYQLITLDILCNW